jgi:heme exporter protein B
VSTFARQVYAVFAKDLLIEWRTRELLIAMVVFAFLALVTFNFALDLRPELVGVVGRGVLWVVIVFAGTVGLGRSFAAERDQGTLEGLLVAPLDRGALYLAKVAGNLLFMAVVELVTVVAFVALFNVAVDPLPLTATLALGTLGLAATGTLFAGMASNTRAREVMLPVLLFPIIVPLLIGVVQASAPALGDGFAREAPWLSLLVAFDVVYLAAGVVAFDYVLEE